MINLIQILLENSFGSINDLNQYILSYPDEVKHFTTSGLLPLHILCLNYDPIPLSTMKLLLDLFPLSVKLPFQIGRECSKKFKIVGTFNIADFLYHINNQDAFETIWSSSAGKYIKGRYLDTWNSLNCDCPSIFGNSEAHDIRAHYLKLQIVLRKNPSQVWIINDSGRNPLQTAIKYNCHCNVLRTILRTMKFEALSCQYSSGQVFLRQGTNINVLII